MSNSTRSRAHAAVIAALAAARTEAGKTQRDVAEALPEWLGITHITLAKIETGRRSLSFVEAREIARVIGISVQDLDRRTSELLGLSTGVRRKK